MSGMEEMIAVYIAVLGAVVGSFVNVVVYRLPRGESVISPGSRCTACSQPIKWYDNIPVLSWFILGGKCRNCGAGFSFRYPAVELATAFVFIALYRIYGLTPGYIHYLTLSVMLLAASLIDIEHQIIPNKIIIVGLAAGMLSVLFLRPVSLIDSISGALLMASVLYFIGFLGKTVLKKEAMGFGDVKFALMIGLYIGWKPALLGLFLSAVFASLFGMGAMAVRRLSFGEPFPFGPFIAVGSLVSALWGDSMVGAYLRWAFG